MTRSLINSSLRYALDFFAHHGFVLPEYSLWGLKDWLKNQDSCREIFAARLGWDVTDFGLNDFTKFGRTIFTLRNGVSGSDTYTKPYSQKVMCLRPGQESPLHYHQKKMEDIINIAGGRIAISMWLTDKNGKLSNNPLSISRDGISLFLEAGNTIFLSPGQSVTLPPRTCHRFWAQVGFPDVLSMEVSSVCDDLSDNIWLKPAERFPKITEDEDPLHLLCSDYSKFIPA